jgi:hypothetical protein
MKVYQVVLVDGYGAIFEEFATPKIFKDREKAEEYRQFFLKEDTGWFRIYVKELEYVE